jgi:beta-mannosidase
LGEARKIIKSENILDLTQLDWTLRGWRPHVWKLGKSEETGEVLNTDIAPVPAKLPGSVQANLRDNGLLPDWNVGLNSLLCEWAEHRHWDFSAFVSQEDVTRVLASGERVFLCAQSLDYSGWILVDNVEVATFRGSLAPQQIELTKWIKPDAQCRISVIFDAPPEEQGQIGSTVRSKFFKTRYSYGWDWCPRLVPAGVQSPFTLQSGRALAVTLNRAKATLHEDNTHGDLQLEIGFDQTLSPNLKDVEVEAVLRDANNQEIARQSARVLADGATLDFSKLEHETGGASTWRSVSRRMGRT